MRPAVPRKVSWHVELGSPQLIRRYTYPREAADPLQILGVIQKGGQRGALGRLDGGYVLVVGDHLTPLNTSQIERVLKNAGYRSSGVTASGNPPSTVPTTLPVLTSIPAATEDPVIPATWQRPTPPTAAVTIKKVRRIPVLP